MWLFKKTIPDDEEHLKLLTRAKAHCALTVRHLMKDQRSITACEVALKFADGEATRDELRTAYAAAAAYAAYAAYAADAADAADADAAIDAAYTDTDAAYAAAAAAAYAAADTDVAYAAAAAAAAAADTDVAYAAYAADAAYADAAAAYAAYAADAADADAASKTKNQKETADICRKYLPIEIWKI